MNQQILKNFIKTFVLIFLLSTIASCSSSIKTESTESTTSSTETIPDSIVQFLMTSAISDFQNHQPPTPADFRNVKIGYIASPKNENIYVMCGEFLSKDNNEWVDFTTIKTSGYEHYIGTTQYCQNTTFVLKDEKLSSELKKRFIK